MHTCTHRRQTQNWAWLIERLGTTVFNKIGHGTTLGRSLQAFRTHQNFIGSRMQVLLTIPRVDDKLVWFWRNIIEQSQEAIVVRKSGINKKKRPRQGCWSQKSGVGMHLRSQNLEIQGGKTIRGKKDQKILNCENLPFAMYMRTQTGTQHPIVRVLCWDNWTCFKLAASETVPSAGPCNSLGHRSTMLEFASGK